MYFFIKIIIRQFGLPFKSSSNKQLSIYYNFEDISKQNTEEFNPDNNKVYLNTIFELTKNLMKKETYIHEGKFDEILEFILKGDNNSSEITIRKLKEESLELTGICEETVFQKTL